MKDLTLMCPLCERRFADPQRNCPSDGSPLTRIDNRIVAATGKDISPVPPTSEATDFDPFRSRLSAIVRTSGSRDIPLQSGDRLVIGRGAESPLASLCGDNISRRHAEIVVDETGVYIIDDNSLNGTFVEGSRIAPRTPYRLVRTCAIHLGADPFLPLTVEVQECQ